MSIKSQLHDEITEELNCLKKIEVGSDTYKTAVDGITKLMDKSMEMEKFEAELKEKSESREFDEDIRIMQMAEDRKDRAIRNGISIVGIVIPTVVTIWGTLKSLKFEETGTVTSLIGRGFLNKLLPKK